MFVNLHVHTGYSFLDGLCLIDPLVKRVKDLGQPAVAITDHGGMYGAVEFYKACEREGLHPVIGCEVYFALDRTVREKPKEEIVALGEKVGLRYQEFDRLIKSIQNAPEHSLELLRAAGCNTPEEIMRDIDALGLNIFHLVLLAKDNEGLKNLYHIVSDAHQNGFYYKPRTDLSVLREYGKGLIGLSACLAGRLPYLLLSDMQDEAEKYARAMAECLDEFYLEIQPNSIPAQAVVNKMLVDWAAKYSLPLVATCDSHYILKEDHEYHDLLLCIQTHKTVQDEDRMRFSNDFWIKSEEEVKDGFAYLGDRAVEEAVANTVKIAEACRVNYTFGQYYFPVLDLNDMTPEEHLRRETKRNLFKYALETGVDMAQYQERLNYELDLICRSGFAPYFLIVQDYIRWAKENGIAVGPGRGSAAGSLVTYLLGITDLDPIEFGLMFERFLSPERVEMPDIDTDFCYENRGRVLEYIRQRYGADRVAHICTYGTMGLKTAIRDVARALGYPYQVGDRLSKAVPDDAQTITEAIANSYPLQQMANDYPDVVRFVEKLQDTPRHVGTHASGIVISPGPMEEFVPLFVDKDGQLVTMFEMNTLAELGLIKMDVLGLKTLTIIERALQMIGEPIDLNRIPLDDQDVFRLFQTAETDGVFQLESDMFKRILTEMRPTSFEDVVALVALGRPGPLGSGMVDQYIDRKHGKSRIEYMHPDLEEILAPTYGVIVYQEQVMAIARKMAGYTLGQADSLRKAMGKKKPELMALHRQWFIDGTEVDDKGKPMKHPIPGAVKMGYDRELAEEVFDLMAKFAEYGFNLAHSTCYGYIAYQTAWLKAHYPLEFMTALMSMEAESNNKDDLAYYIRQAERMGIKVLLPDINRSGVGFTVDNGAARMGLACIDGVGENMVRTLIEGQPYESFDDLIARVSPNKKVVVNLIKAGACDCFEKDRHKLINYYFATYRPKEKDFEPLPPMEKKDRRQAEIDTLGLSISVKTAWEKAKDGADVTIAGRLVDVREHIDKRSRAMGFLKLATEEDVREVVVFAREYSKYLPLLKQGQQLKIAGKKDGDKLLCNSIRYVS